MTAPRFLLILFIASISCTSIQKEEQPVEIETEQIKFASGFTISRTSGGTILEVLRPYPGASNSLKYFLSANGEERSGMTAIQVPIKTLVSTSTTHLSMIDYLGEARSLVAFPTTDYISTPSIRERVDNGLIRDLGNQMDMNMESLVDIAPDLVVNYSTEDLKSTQRIQSMGINVVMNGDYLENHPLGRAEWIKVFGLLFDKYDVADSIYTEIERNYLAAINEGASNTDCVFSGSIYGDAWYMPGGKNYAARLLQDAGFSYAVTSDTTFGFLQWGYENVYEIASECDYWIGPAPFADLEALGEADSRYRDFKAFSSGNVYVYDKRKGPTGGNEYLELGYLRPDIILKDLIKIRDPLALPDHQLYFYRKLK